MKFVEVLRRMMRNSDQSILTLGQSNQNLEAVKECLSNQLQLMNQHSNQLQLMNQHLGEIIELQRAELVMQRDQAEALDNLAVAIRESLLASQRTTGLTAATAQSGGVKRVLES